MSNTALLGSYASQAGTGLTFKNRLINGDMKISQRFGTGNATITAGSLIYVTDRWGCFCAGAGGTASQVSAAIAGHTKALKLVPSAGNTYASFVQRVESVNIEDLASSVVTFSGWVYVDNATGVTATVEAYTANSVDSFGTVTQLTITNPTISLTSGSYVYFEKQINLPAGASNGTQFAVAFTGAASKDLRFTGASLEAGPTATPFERRPIGVELGMCQRYYISANASTSAHCYATNTWMMPRISFPVEMRVSPTTLTFATSTGGLTGVTPTANAPDSKGTRAVFTFTGTPSQNSFIDTGYFASAEL